MTSATYPVRVDAHLEPPLSRWLWLVKWFLAIPHYIVLSFLWVAFGVLSVIAFFSILFAGRYPRAIFEFNVGVIRWTWRVSYYTFGALGTDRYPPFSLEEAPDYPAHLAIEYPERLSRGLVLVKWWLLAIPHLIIVGLLVGGALFTWDRDWPFAGGLITVLAVVAGLVLAFTGRYPTDLFDLIMGLNRWVLRVAAYVGLMTDQYPPFRLDVGGDEPGGLTVQQPQQQLPSEPVQPYPQPAPPSRWTGGKIVSVVIGAILVLMSFGLLAGGSAALWADRELRDNAGFITTDPERFTTPTYALTTERADFIIDGGGWRFVRSVVGTVRVDVTPVTNRPIFVGIAESADIQRYLGNVERAAADNIRNGENTVTYAGGQPASPPTAQSFWVASSVGPGARSIQWEVESGSWGVVVMNADASRGIDVRADAGAEVPVLNELGFGLLIAGAFALVLGATMIIIPIVKAR